MTIPLLVGGLIAVFSGAVLFANAVEWAGKRLGLGVERLGVGALDDPADAPSGPRRLFAGGRSRRFSQARCAVPGPLFQ